MGSMNSPNALCRESLRDRETAFIQKYSFIEDPQERLQAVCSYSHSVAPVPGEECHDGNLVRGCSSPVWLCGVVKDGRLTLTMSSPTPLVKSLAGIICDLCDQATPGEIEAWEPVWLTELRIDRHLSATRQNGLAAILQRIREILHDVGNK
jgi:cysteine desulfuration protein SufE